MLYSYQFENAQYYKQNTVKLFSESTNSDSLSSRVFLHTIYNFHYNHQYFDSLDRAMAIRANRNNSDLQIARVAIVSALLANSAGRLNEMNEHIQKAFSLLPKSQPSVELGMTIYCQANYYRRKKMTKAAMEQILWGIEIAKDCNNPRLEA